MKIIRTIKITNEQFYDYLEQQLSKTLKTLNTKKFQQVIFKKDSNTKRRMPNLNLLLKFIFNNM